MEVDKSETNIIVWNMVFNHLAYFPNQQGFYFIRHFFATLILLPPIFQPLVSLTAACAYSMLLYSIRAIPLGLSNTTCGGRGEKDDKNLAKLYDLPLDNMWNEMKCVMRKWLKQE